MNDIGTILRYAIGLALAAIVAVVALRYLGVMGHQVGSAAQSIERKL